MTEHEKNSETPIPTTDDISTEKNHQKLYFFLTKNHKVRSSPGRYLCLLFDAQSFSFSDLHQEIDFR